MELKQPQKKSLTSRGNTVMMENNEICRRNYFVKYLSEDLKKEYDRVSAMCLPIEGLQHPMIIMDDVLRAYFILADYFTDDSVGGQKEQMLVGLRSKDLLASALSRQNVSFAGRAKYSEPIEICSTLFYGLVKNHAFLDGNKRVALLVLLYQLFLYGYVPNVPEKEFEKLVVSVAANDIDRRVIKKFKADSFSDKKEVLAIAYILRRMVKKKNASYHISMTAKEFCDAVTAAGATAELDNGKLKFKREIKKKWPFPKEVVSYAIPFNGWTRTIGAKTARDVLRNIKLYDQYASYQDFLAGGEPMYQLVQQFEGPLRRLKDE